MSIIYLEKNMNKPLISVIVPIYNVEKFLIPCLESIINQTYKNLEIILINDGSKDNSRLICEKYVSIDKRITLINQENKGISAARNKGLDNATGEYIGFIDSDDVVSLEFYECLYDLIKETDSDISECKFVKIKEDDVFNKKYKFEVPNDPQYVVLDRMGAFKKLHNKEVDIVVKSLVVWNKLYKRNVFNNIRFPEGKLYEDDFTTYKVLNQINKLVSSDIILYGYVQRSQSIMNQKFSIKRLDALEAFDNYVEFFKRIQDIDLFKCCLLRYLRVLVKMLDELYESDYTDKEKVRKILKNKFDEIYRLTDEYDKKQNSIILENNTQSKEVYYKKFYNILEINGEGI